MTTDDRAVLVDRLGEHALTSLVRVARQPRVGGQEVSGLVPVSSLDGFHTRRVSGGRAERSYLPHMYAYGKCTDLPVGHLSTHGKCPHRIRVCVQNTERDDVWEVLCELAGYTPLTKQQIDNKRRDLVAELKRRYARRIDDNYRELRTPGLDRGIPPARLDEAFDLGMEFVGGVVGALRMRELEVFEGAYSAAYFDRETGGVVFISEVDDSYSELLALVEGAEGRFEEIAPLPKEEAIFVGEEGILEVARTFLMTRGFKLKAS